MLTLEARLASSPRSMNASSRLSLVALPESSNEGWSPVRPTVKVLNMHSIPASLITQLLTHPVYTKIGIIRRLSVSRHMLYPTPHMVAPPDLPLPHQHQVTRLCLGHLR